MAAICAIYAIRNKVDGKMYIGSTLHLARRWRLHRQRLIARTHHSPHLQSAYEKYGAENFAIEVVEYVDNAREIVQREQIWLEFFKPAYNIAKCATMPTLGLRHSAETRALMRAAHLGRKRAPFTAEHRANISAGKTGRKPNLTPEARERQRARMLGNKLSVGKNLSKQHRANLSKAQIARWRIARGEA